MNWENRGWGGGGGESKIEQRKTVQEQEAKMARKKNIKSQTRCNDKEQRDIYAVHQ